MNWHTPLPPLDTGKKIDLAQPLVALGSCFATHIGQRLQTNKFNILLNPFGTLFDPYSINRLLTYSFTHTLPDSIHDVQVEGTWRNLEVHSTLAATSQPALRNKIKKAVKTTGQALQAAKWLIITFGTARIYRYQASGRHIANCQKLPAGRFTREMATPDNLLDDTARTFDLLLQHNPDLQIIVTVSPVRHIRDGLTTNSLSKATLRLLCHQLSERFRQVHYYPAYELMLDDLRDYRFYQPDLLHPNEQAIDYIWEHFSHSFFNQKTRSFIKKWQAILKALQHRPFNPHTTAHRQFLQSTLKKLQTLTGTVDTSNEIKQIERQLAQLS